MGMNVIALFLMAVAALVFFVGGHIRIRRWVVGNVSLGLGLMAVAFIFQFTNVIGGKVN